MLAAAKAHMMARGEVVSGQPRAKLDPEADIPLPPLPAAQDRDPEAMKDTRPTKPITPPQLKVSFIRYILIEIITLTKITTVQNYTCQKSPHSCGIVNQFSPRRCTASG